MTKSYRIKSTPGKKERSIRINVTQDFDFLEILSLKLRQEDVYTRFCADYGVVAGRVIVNGGYGVPNANVSIFVPLDAIDENDPVISTLYPYKNVEQKNEDGYRYNLLPYVNEYDGHTATGTFPDKNDVLTRTEVLEVYEKYYKFTVKTNESGDFMIIGAPLGIQTLILDLDLSNIGCFSLRPADLIRSGLATPEQFNGDQFKSSSDLSSLPQIVNINCKVRVSQLPIFAGTGPLEDSVCLGQNTNLIGGVTAQDTVGVTIPGGEYQVGGIFAGLTFLPDGAGQQYETSIGISGFDQTTLITSSANFDQLCLDIEHSYIGDIEITLTCPNGTTVSIMNAYNGTPFGWTALVPGGCGSGIGTSLGNDTNIDGGAPGSPVWSYCFSPTNATLGTICAENTAGNTIPNDYTAGGVNLPNGTTGNNIAMDTNGVYLPDGNFNDFIETIRNCFLRNI